MNLFRLLICDASFWCFTPTDIILFTGVKTIHWRSVYCRHSSRCSESIVLGGHNEKRNGPLLSTLKSSILAIPIIQNIFMGNIHESGNKNIINTSLVKWRLRQHRLVWFFFNYYFFYFLFLSKHLLWKRNLE